MIYKDLYLLWPFKLCIFQQRLVLSGTPQDRTVKLPSGPGQINDRNRDQRSVQDSNGSGKLNSSSTEKKTNLQNVQRKQYNDNLQQQHTYAERGLKNYETSDLDKRYDFKL